MSLLTSALFAALAFTFIVIALAEYNIRRLNKELQLAKRTNNPAWLEFCRADDAVYIEYEVAERSAWAKYRKLSDAAYEKYEIVNSVR